jgi:hypothetical protein
MKSTPTAPSGCETSSERGLSHQAKSINATLGKSMLATLTASHNAISSQGSEDGATPSVSRCTQTIDLFGQDPAPASPSPQPERAKHQAMNATSGPNGSDLSAQFDRQSSLANRLKRRLDGVGSTLFTLTWRRKATPLGRPYYQLAASGRRISGSDFGSWATPSARDWKAEDRCDEIVAKRQAHPRGKPLSEQAHGMPSPGSPAQTESKGQLASWPTPNAMEGGQTSRGGDRKDEKLMGGLPTGKGQLNPSFSLWLMGYPAEWLSCAPQATRSSRKSRQSSSRRA